MNEKCPVCGQAVRVSISGEGTGCYLPVDNTEIVKNLREELESETKWAHQYHQENEKLREVVKMQTEVLKSTLGKMYEFMRYFEENSKGIGVLNAIKAGENILNKN